MTSHVIAAASSSARRGRRRPRRMPSLLRREEKDDPFGGFTLGCQSYTFRNFDLEQALKRIKDLGLHYVEFYPDSTATRSTATPEQIKAILKLCKDYDITPIAFGVQSFTKDHDANKKLFEFGKALGIKTFSADPDPDSFDSLDKLCDEYKIAIAIHPHGPQGNKLHRWYSAEVILAAVKDHNALIGTCLDTGHLIRCRPTRQEARSGRGGAASWAHAISACTSRTTTTRSDTDVVFGKGRRARRAGACSRRCAR